MSQHKEFIISTDMNVYFADPASPWERGTNENTNGLIRQYFSGGTAFDKIRPQRMKFVQDRLNDWLRLVVYNYTPNQAFFALVASDP